MAPTKRLISYLRVSTRKQGQSGLGIEAQREAVQRHAGLLGATIEAEYVEIESGKLADRQELQRAITHARRSKATLCVAKLDRLSRNAAFLLTLRDSGLPLLFCDMPGCNELTIGIMAVVAEAERKMISQRTKDALAAAKARGQKLGSARRGHWNGREDRRRAGARKGARRAAEAHRQSADEAYTDILPAMQKARAKGESLQAIADGLNNQGHVTRRGCQWTPMQVRRVLNRAGQG